MQLIRSLKTPSGAGVTLLRLSEGLADQGYRVTAAYFLEDGGVLVDHLKARGIEVVDLGWGRERLSRLERLKLVFRLRRLIHNRRINVVHSHHWDADFYGACAVILSKVRHVVTIHSASYFKWADSQRGWYQNIIFPATHTFVTVCEYLAKQIRAFDPNLSPRTRVIHNAPPDVYYQNADPKERSRLRRELGIGEDQFVIGSVGNLSPAKGTGFLIDALAGMPEGNYKLLLVGASYEGAFESLLEEKGLTDKVILAGVRTDIPGLLEAIDLLVHPSVEEADPWVVSEAMAKGKLIVACRVGGIPEKVIDGKTGFLVPPGDSRALAEKIVYCMNTPAEMQEMGRAARKHIAENFPFETMVDRYRALYS